MEKKLVKAQINFYEQDIFDAPIEKVIKSLQDFKAASEARGFSNIKLVWFQEWEYCTINAEAKRLETDEQLQARVEIEEKKQAKKLKKQEKERKLLAELQNKYPNG